jgi:hypothetical protein
MLASMDPLIRIYIGPGSFPDEEAMNKFLAACRSDNLNPNYHFCMDGYPVPEIEFIITIDILSLDVNRGVSPQLEPVV